MYYVTLGLAVLGIRRTHPEYPGILSIVNVFSLTKTWDNPGLSLVSPG